MENQEGKSSKQPATPWKGKEIEKQGSAIESVSYVTADFMHQLTTKPDLSEQLASTDASMVIFLPTDNKELTDTNRQIGMRAEQNGEKVSYIIAEKSNPQGRYDSFSVRGQSRPLEKMHTVQEQGNSAQ